MVLYKILLKEKSLIIILTVAFAASVFLGLTRFESATKSTIPKNPPAMLLAIKQRFEDSLAASLPEPHASLMAGIILGSKGNIPKNILQDFQTAGISHILALSGFNLTVLGVALMALLSIFVISPKQRFFLTMTVIVLFILMVGGQASLIRAGIMAALVNLSTVVGRIPKPLNMLVLAAGVMLFLDPTLLAFNLGFELTFLATMGIFFVAPIIEKYFARFMPPLWGLREAVAATLGAIIMTEPLILHIFGRFSVVALLTNMAVTPLVPLAMLLGFITGFAGIVLPVLGQLLGAIAWLVLSYIINVTEWFASLPFASLNVPKLSLPIMLISYALLGFLYLLLKRRARAL